MSAKDEIETVARALCRATIMECHDFCDVSPGVTAAINQTINQQWRDFEGDAKVAMLATLEVIREPTVTMIEAGADWRLPREVFVNQWHLAIDAKKAEINAA